MRRIHLTWAMILVNVAGLACTNELPQTSMSNSGKSVESEAPTIANEPATGLPQTELPMRKLEWGTPIDTLAYVLGKPLRVQPGDKVFLRWKWEAICTILGLPPEAGLRASLGGENDYLIFMDSVVGVVESLSFSSSESKRAAIKEFKSKFPSASTRSRSVGGFGFSYSTVTGAETSLFLVYFDEFMMTFLVRVSNEFLIERHRQLELAQKRAQEKREAIKAHEIESASSKFK